MKKNKAAVLDKTRATDPLRKLSSRQKAITGKLQEADPFRDKPHPLIAAVGRLRRELKLTQQEFADRLGIAIATMVRYENNRVPRGKALSRLEALATANGFEDLAKLFRDALVEELGALPPGDSSPAIQFRSEEERELVDVLLEVFRHAKYSSQAKSIEKTLGPIIQDHRRRVEEHEAVSAQQNAMAGLLDKGRSAEEVLKLFRSTPEAVAEAFFSRSMKSLDARSYDKKMCDVVDLLLKDGWTIRSMAERFANGVADDFVSCANSLKAHNAIREYEDSTEDKNG